MHPPSCSFTLPGLRRFRCRTGAFSLLLVLALLLPGCSGDGVPDAPLGTPPPPPTRPGDGLLERSVLQDVVDRQVERDGQALRAFLAHEDPGVRARAAFALASVQDPEAGQDLAELLEDPVAAVREDAAFALGQLPGEGYGAVLLQALAEEEDAAVRLRLLEAVGKVGGSSALAGLLEAELRGEETGALHLALARMGIRGVTTPASVSLLVEGLRSQAEGARTRAAYYFGRSTDPQPWAARAREIRGVLDSLPPRDPLAIHLLKGLARLDDPADTPRFLWWMESSPDWRVRAEAAAANTGRTADPAVRGQVFQALEDPSTHVAVNAAGVLAGSRQIPPREREELKDWVENHPDQWQRAGPILDLLGRMGEGAFLRSWLERWEESQVEPRTRGLGAMAFVPGEETTRTLVEALESPRPRIRATAMGALARRWRVERQDTSKHDLYFKAFARGVGMGDPGTVYVAAPALADSIFQSMGSVELLIQEYGTLELPEDLEGMQAILRALGQTGSPAAEVFLEEVLRRPDRALRQEAARALSNLRGQEVDVGVEAGEAERRVNWEGLAALGPRPRLVLETEKGTVRLVLLAENAPLTVQTIAGFAAEGLYDGVPFHRVVPNFVVQGGDFARQDGFGGPGFSIRSEFTHLPYHRGVVGMASAGKDTEGSQFFITHSMQPHLEGSYTAFGWVEEGMDVVDRLYVGDRIVTARVEDGGS